MPMTDQWENLLGLPGDAYCKQTWIDFCIQLATTNVRYDRVLERIIKLLHTRPGLHVEQHAEDVNVRRWMRGATCVCVSN